MKKMFRKENEMSSRAEDNVGMVDALLAIVTLKRHSEAKPKNPEIILDPSHSFRMTIPALTLAAVLSFSIISESRAEVIIIQ